MRRLSVTLGLAAAVSVLPSAQTPFSDSVRAFIKVDATVVALTNVRVIDGTGAPARASLTVIIRNGNIEAMGDTASLTPPAGATTLDLAGRSVIPGLVMVHEHLYYPAGPGVYGQLGESFIRLYLAGGVTTMRTGGNVIGSIAACLVCSLLAKRITVAKLYHFDSDCDRLFRRMRAAKPMIG